MFIMPVQALAAVLKRQQLSAANKLYKGNLQGKEEVLFYERKVAVSLI